MKTYKNLSEALKDTPKTSEEWTKLLQQENSSTSENKKEEVPEPTNKYEIRFVKNPKKQKQKSIQEKKNSLKGKQEKEEQKYSKKFLEILKRNPTSVNGMLEENHPKGFQL